MANAHAQSVQGALHSGERLGVLFDRMGNADNPRGVILAAYRTARNAVRGRTDSVRAMSDALATLRNVVASNSSDLLQSAVALGVGQAERELRAYGVKRTAPKLADEVAAAQVAWLAALDAQLGAARALALTGGDEGEIIGDETRAGVLTPGPVLQAGAMWLASIFALGWSETVKQSAGKDEFYKQAIAAIDHRTTDCCLRVHGQTQPIDKPFKLTGEPRYADEIDDPPFHWYCRTAEALVPREFADDALTREMKDAASAEIKARKESGRRETIHPADAFSRR